MSCGWSGQDCGVAANICCGLQAVELDPRDGDERPAGPSQYRRVRVLPTHAADGVLEVFDSSDCEATNPDDGLAQVDIFGDDLESKHLAQSLQRSAEPPSLEVRAQCTVAVGMLRRLVFHHRPLLGQPVRRAVHSAGESKTAASLVVLRLLPTLSPT